MKLKEINVMNGNDKEKEKLVLHSNEMREKRSLCPSAAIIFPFPFYSRNQFPIRFDMVVVCCVSVALLFSISNAEALNLNHSFRIKE